MNLFPEKTDLLSINPNYATLVDDVLNKNSISSHIKVLKNTDMTLYEKGNKIMDQVAHQTSIANIRFDKINI